MTFSWPSIDLANGPIKINTAYLLWVSENESKDVGKGKLSKQNARNLNVQKVALVCHISFTTDQLTLLAVSRGALIPFLVYRGAV